MFQANDQRVNLKSRAAAHRNEKSAVTREIWCGRHIRSDVPFFAPDIAL
jgi:hypothetical protein